MRILLAPKRVRENCWLSSDRGISGFVNSGGQLEDEPGLSKKRNLPVFEFETAGGRKRLA